MFSFRIKTSVRVYVLFLFASAIVATGSTLVLRPRAATSPNEGAPQLLPARAKPLDLRGPTLGQQRSPSVVRVTQEKDQPVVDITLSPADQPAQVNVGTNVTINVSILSRVNAESSTLAIAVAGGASSPILSSAQWQSTQRTRSLLPDVAVKQTAERDFGPLRLGEKKTQSIPIRFTAAGVGYLVAALRSPAKGQPLINEAMTLYFLLADNTVYWSTHSVLNLREQQLRANLKRQGATEEEIEKRVQRLRRGGAENRKKVSPPSKSSGPINSNPASYNSVTVHGTVRFTDVSGNTHPVRFSTVQIFDEEAGTDELVDTTLTDNNGNYSSTVDDNDGDGTGRDFYVVALAQGATVSVEDFANPGDVWSIDSLPAQTNVADGSTLNIDLTATNNLANANNVAFEVYEAVNAESRYFPTLGEALPAAVIMSYPGPGDGSFYDPGTQTVTTAGTDCHDWDNLEHEYGHHIQHLFDIEDSPGGAHNLGQNLCTAHGKNDGLRLAWGESWPTFFAVMVQRELNLSTLAIPNLGDTSYTDTKPMPPDLTYDLEPSSAGFQGESDEVALQRALWDFYDPTNDDGDTVSLTPQDLWDVVTNDHSDTFSSFWRALILLRTESQKAALGEILQDHGIGTLPTNPAGGTTFSGGANPNFQWTGNLECDTGGNARYSLRAYNNDFTSLIWASPWQASANLTPTNAQRDLIFVGPAAPLRWLVASRDTTVPETGAYYGSALVINDEFAVPDRGPVDLILALDISDSMNSPVPGTTSGLTKIQLLRQAAEVFLQTWRLHRVDGDRIGVVYLNSNTSSIPPAPPVLRNLATDADTVVTDIRSKTASGCTALGGALQVAF
ncbi:MAG TPA: VWA domain-containing protein, partial [Pyrinomonadaceae bacterium]|nr:VWA domain-containing protein [Pyrinomonadaceae bacterium]